MDVLVICLYWLFAGAAFLAGRRGLIILFFCSIPFGSFAVLPPAVTGGLTFTPFPISALLIVLHSTCSKAGLTFILHAGTRFGELGLLTAFWLVAVVVTAFMPSLFAGDVMVIPMRVVDEGRAPLAPTLQNVSQLAYLTISVMTVFAFARILRDRALHVVVLHGICLSAALMIGTGLLDLAGQYVPLDFLLEPFRTASYALLTEAEILGAKRIVGLMPEASAYGATCLTVLGMLYFFRRAVDRSDFFAPFIPVLIAGLVVFAWLSTSSATYVGLAGFAVLVAAEWAWRVLTLPQRSGKRTVLVIEVALVGAGVFGIAAILLFSPAALDSAGQAINEIVFQKTESSSFDERQMWTAVSWQAVLDTYGLGVGVGGTRASNSAVATISNIGFLGALLYSSFFLLCMVQRAPRGDLPTALMLSAARWSIFPSSMLGLLIGTSPDFGVQRAFIYGLIMAIGSSAALEARRTNDPAFRLSAA